MASGTVYRKQLKIPETKTYGFQLLPPRKVRSVSERLHSTPIRQTRSAHAKLAAAAIQFQKVIELPERFVSSAISLPQADVSFQSDDQATHDTEDPVSAIALAQKPATKQDRERELQRIVRRLQRPTTSYEGQVGKHRSCRETGEFSLGKMQESVASQKKWLNRLARPTTASALKRLKACVYCDDANPDIVKFEQKLQQILPSDPALNETDCDEIINRLRTPTHATLHGQYECIRYPPEMREKRLPRDLPLISGLKRSDNYMEITNRLASRKKTRQTEYTIF